MRLSVFVRIVLVLGLFWLLFSPVEAQSWEAWAFPEDAGFDAAQLEEVRAYADGLQSGAVMVVYQGRVLAAWGDIERKFKAHSVRKSLVSALYGILVEEGKIYLDATLEDLGIDDDTPLTDQERGARVHDLIAARSGVYLHAAYAPSDQDRDRPERDSHAPGTNWFYNNWDFNVAGVILEQATGKDLYELFDELIAEALGMEDFDVDDGLVVFEPSESRHPAHTFRISTRDLARFGQLYLQEGRWNGDQVVPAEWVAESTAPTSDFGGGDGYGYMWWTHEPGSIGSSYPTVNQYSLYLGRGTGGQAVVVIPEAEIVIVHRGDTDHDRRISGSNVWRLIERILAAQTGEPDADAETDDVVAIPFESQLPRPERPEFVELDSDQWAEYYGEYQIAPGVAARVFEWNDRAFVFFPGEGEGELFALGNDRFTVRVVDGVDIRFERDDEGAVEAMEVVMGEQRIRAMRL